MALNGLLRADVPLRNCSLTHSLTKCVAEWKEIQYWHPFDDESESDGASRIEADAERLALSREQV